MTFPSEQFWRSTLLVAVSGITAVLMLKIWENKERMKREIRRQFDSNEARQPEEHDERLG